MTRRNALKQGWVFPLFSPNSNDRLSLNFHRFVILYRSCGTQSVGLGQQCLPKGSNGFKVQEYYFFLLFSCPVFFFSSLFFMDSYSHACTCIRNVHYSSFMNDLKLLYNLSNRRLLRHWLHNVTVIFCGSERARVCSVLRAGLSMAIL